MKIHDFLLLLVSVLRNPWPGALHFIDPPHPCLLADICNHTWFPECGHYSKTNKLRVFTDECDMYEYNCDNNMNYKVTEYYYCVKTEKTCPPVSPCDPYAPGGHLYPGEVIYQTRRRRFFGDGDGKIAVIDRQITKHKETKTTKVERWSTSTREPHKGRYYKFIKRQEAEEKNKRKPARRAAVTKPGCGSARGCRKNLHDGRKTDKPPTLKKPLYAYRPENTKLIYTKFRTALVVKNGKKMVKIFKKVVKGAIGDYDYLEKK